MEDIGLVILIALYILLGLKKPSVALITLPFVAGTILILGIATQDVVIITTSPILFLLTLLAVLLSKKEPDSENWPQLCAKWFFIGLIILISILASFSGIVLSGFFGILCIMFVIIFISSIITYSLTSKNMTTAYVLSTIGSSMRQNLPLPMALESAASGWSDKRSRILRNIQKWLVQGYSLSESIKRGYPKCPGYAVAMITAAERINQLPLALKAIEFNITARTEESQKIRPVHPIYPVIVITVMFLILIGVMTFIIPQFEQVLKEMLEQLPAATQALLDITNFILLDYGWVFGLLIIMIILILIPASIYFKFRARRPDKPYLFSRMGDFIKWNLPILHWFERNYSLLQVVEMLRLSLNAGCTVNNAIENTIGLDVNNRFKRRLRKWLKKVERGDNIAVAAKESKLGSALAWAFDEQVNQGNTLAILEALEAFYRSNYSYCVNLARFIIWPCIILCMGLIVGFVVYATYSPSIAIIKHLVTLVTP
jgi:type IV pilus assembly protein PilC